MNFCATKYWPPSVCKAATLTESRVLGLGYGSDSTPAASLQDLSCGGRGQPLRPVPGGDGKAVLGEGRCPQAEGALTQPSLGGRRLFNAGPVTEDKKQDFLRKSLTW